ncbi:MAG: alpha-L-arabinofuranosidase C-terminal domain-containing protein [Balneolaceae bacterium]|nr:alpha-L-arabinofuranosidase C-terminal domain-containing protein [Balneolaceae bacterium]
MKKLKFLFILIALIGFFSLSLQAQKSAVIKIDPDRIVGEIDPNIYGSFLEPLSRGNGFGVVYGSLYDPSSPFADENGFRKDYIQQIKELKVPVIRWPGGNFVSGYNWEDGIGPKDQRPASLDLSRTRIESNQMGTDEYAIFSELVGAENFICINAGTGTIEDAGNWVEYTNYPKGTHYSDLRRKFGNEEPFNVKYWALGNEADGPWQLGHKNKEDYVKFAIEAAKLMESVDEDINLIASGSSNYPLVHPEYNPRDGWIEWNDYVLDKMVGKIDYISIHRYATQALRGLEEPEAFANRMSLGLEIDQKIEIVKGLIEKAMVKSGSDRQVYISFDEYGARGNNISGSLLLAQHLNSFIRHADIVKMANLTFLSSLVGLTPDGSYKNTLYYPFYLYSNNARGTSLDVYTDSETYSNELFEEIPYLDVTAVLNETKNMIVVNVVNRSETEAFQTEVILQAGEYSGSVKINEINAAAIDLGNSITEENVKIETQDIELTNNIISHSFPAHSITQLEIPLK